MYKLKYYSDFKDVQDNLIRGEIYLQTTEAIQPELLKLAADAITVEYTSNDIYKPLKQSCCTVNVFTDRILTDLYTGKLNDVMLKVYRNSKLFWYGFLTPNIYSSEFSDDYDLLSLEFIDSIAQLENTKYTSTGNVISSFHSVLSHIFNIIDKDKIINKIYLHSSLSVDNSSDILNKLHIQERNFFDEENEAQTNKEVVEDIISYLGMSLIQFGDTYYILDYEALKKGNYNFICYDRINGSNTDVIVASDVRNIKDIGISEANATISLGNVYNKVNVIANTNQIDDTVPDMFEDLKNQNTDPDKFYETVKDDTTYLSAYFNSSKFKTHKPVKGYDGSTIEEVTATNVNDIWYGSFFQKNDSYITADGEPSSINWKDAVTLAEPYYSGSGILPIIGTKEFKALSYSKEYVIFKKGYIILNFNYMYNNSSFFEDTSADKDISYSSTKFGTGFDNTKFMCKLKIGRYYWTGERWADWEAEYLPVKDKYENSLYSFEVLNGVTHYYYTYKGVKTEVTLDEYNKMRVQDRFYLVHKNKEGDLIFNTWKPLTNQVSYKDNLVDSEDGVLIPLPNNVLFGSMELHLYAPNELGDYANYRTDGSGGVYNTYVRYCHIKDLKFVYTNNKNYIDVFGNEEYDPDILYSNVIDSANVTELDDITLKVNTYSNSATSYSYVLTKTKSGYDFVDKLDNKNLGIAKKMEESIIQKYAEHYKQPRFVYSNTLNDKDIKPYTIIHEDIINKNMVVDSVTYDLVNNAATVKTIEL